MTGLGRRTTCDDIIYALLRSDANPNEFIDVTNYAIIERWRGVERPLKGRTKILKVWRAWGGERRHVAFYVRKYKSHLDVSIDLPIKSRRPRRSNSQCSKDKHNSHRQSQSNSQHSKSLPSSREGSRVRGRRELRNNTNSTNPAKSGGSSSTEHYPKEPQTDNEKAKAKEFQDLVQLILHQEKKIQDQLSRIREMDVQIENYETKTHLTRVAENGLNYVQEAYLREREENSGGSTEELFPAMKKEDMETYMHICDNILDLDDKITMNQSQIAELSMQIQEESVLEHPPPFTDLPGDPNESVDSGNGSNPEEKVIAEVEKMRKELEKCMKLTEAQDYQLALVNQTLSECHKQMGKKQSMLESLCVEISLYETNGPCDEEGAKLSPPPIMNDSGVQGSSSSEGNSPEPSQSKTMSSQGQIREGEGRDPSQAKEHRGFQELPSIPVTAITDEAQDKAMMEFYVTKATYPSSSCTSQYNTNKQQGYDNDSNSDTGLSSLHSDEAPPILETLV